MSVSTNPTQANRYLFVKSWQLPPHKVKWIAPEHKFICTFMLWERIYLVPLYR
jgi:hypothetical protein